MNPFLLYLVLILDNILGLLVTTVLISGVGCLLSIALLPMLFDDCMFDDRKQAEAVRLIVAKWRKRLVIAFCISAVLLTFVPSTKQCAVIYVVPKIANNETLQEDCKELYELAIQKMKQELSEERK